MPTLIKQMLAGLHVYLIKLCWVENVRSEFAYLLLFLFRYHRIKRKEEQKKVEKTDLGALSQDNPELFKSELEKAEKLRALVREFF